MKYVVIVLRDHSQNAGFASFEEAKAYLEVCEDCGYEAAIYEN